MKKKLNLLLILLLLITFYIYLNSINEYFSFSGLVNDIGKGISSTYKDVKNKVVREVQSDLGKDPDAVPKKSDMFDTNKCVNNPEDTGKFDTLGCSMSNSLTNTNTFFKEGVSAIGNTFELGGILIE